MHFQGFQAPVRTLSVVSSSKDIHQWRMIPTVPHLTAYTGSLNAPHIKSFLRIQKKKTLCFIKSYAQHNACIEPILENTIGDPTPGLSQFLGKGHWWENEPTDVRMVSRTERPCPGWEFNPGNSAKPTDCAEILFSSYHSLLADSYMNHSYISSVTTPTPHLLHPSDLLSALCIIWSFLCASPSSCPISLDSDAETPAPLWRIPKSGSVTYCIIFQQRLCTVVLCILLQCWPNVWAPTAALQTFAHILFDSWEETWLLWHFSFTDRPQTRHKQ